MTERLVRPYSARYRNRRGRTGRHVSSVGLFFLQSRASLESLTSSARNSVAKAIAGQLLELALTQPKGPCGDIITHNEIISRYWTTGRW